MRRTGRIRRLTGRHRHPDCRDRGRPERRCACPDPHIPTMHFSSSFRTSPHCQLCLLCGTGYNIDADNVREGDVRILLAEVPVKRNACQTNSKVKIDFSTILEVDDNNKVELTIALKRYCGRECTVLAEWNLEFDQVESLPFSFTYCDELTDRRRYCVYRVEITNIEVRGGNRVDELKAASTFINAIFQM